MELELLKEIPGYKAILKSVLKAQIQLLIEQLCEQTGEESIILTASLSDGTLSHLGSNMGKGFFEGREEIKSQFLGYCLKKQHNRESPQFSIPHQQNSSAEIYGQSGPKKQRFQASSETGLRQGFVGQHEQDFGELMAHSVPGTSHLKRKTVTRKPPAKSLKSSTLPNFDKSSFENEVMSELNKPSSQVKAEKPSDDEGSYGTTTDDAGDSTSVPTLFHAGHSQTSETGEEDVNQDSNISGTEQSGDSNLDTCIKVEPVTEEEELEITGIEMAGGGGPSVPGNWVPDGSGQFGYQSREDFLNQSGDQINGSRKRKTFECETCQKRFNSKYRLTFHVKNYHSVDPPMNTVCHICHKRFSTKSSLQAHIKVAHIGERKFECQVCYRRFSNKRDLTSHTRQYHAMPKLSCTKCGASFGYKSSLIRHKESCGKINKSFKCPACEKLFVSRNALYMHKRAKHMNEVHICEICGKSFERKSCQTRHVKEVHKHN